MFRWLTGISITSIEEVGKAISQLHEKGVSNVVLTSFEHDPSDGFLSLIGSQKQINDIPARQFEIQFPQLSGYFSGVGDLISALILAQFHICNDNLQLACEQALGTIQSIVRRTFLGRENDLAIWKNSHRETKSGYMRANELKLIESKLDIEQPTVLYRGKPFSFRNRT